MDIRRRVDTGRYAAILFTTLSAVVLSLVVATSAEAKQGNKTPHKAQTPACVRAVTYVANNPQGRFVKQARRFVARHCSPGQPPEQTLPEILSVTSEASCSATIVGTSLAAFEHINMDFDSLIQTPAGYLSYLRVYQPGDPLNLETATDVTVSDEAGLVTITITNQATCGKNMIVTSMLFGSYGVAWYETVQIQP